MKVSLIFFLNTAKKNQTTGKVPVYMRVCFNRLKSESRLNIELKEPEVLRWDPITMRLQERNSTVNHLLNRLEDKLNVFLVANSANLPSHTAHTIRDHLLGKEQSGRKRLQQFVDEYFEKAVCNNVDRTAGTIKNYRKSINHLNSYLSFTGKQGMLLDELNYELASGFKNYLVSTYPSIRKTGMTEVSAAGVIKKFRTIFTEAVEQGYLIKNSFKTVKIKTKSPRRERLSLDQVIKLIKLDLGLYPFQQIYRDLFLFSIFTGFAYRDTMQLNWRNLEKKSNGDVKLTISRQKTDVTTEMFLPKAAQDILNKYKTIVGNDSTEFPYRSNKEINSQLKLIATLAGIPIRLTYHIARHTFRQLLAEAGIIDYGVIKRLMGQSRNGDVDEIYFHVTENLLLEAKNKLDNLLNSNI